MNNDIVPSSSEKAKAPRKTLHFLILEDNPADAELIEYELREAGFSFTSKIVDSEFNYKQALQDFCPDMILSDYDLPHYNGIQALAAAKEQCPDTPFILVTGAISEDRAIEVLTGGARDYVLKNRMSRLIPAVTRALAESEGHRARKIAEEQLRLSHKELEKIVQERTASLRDEIAERRHVEKELQQSIAREQKRVVELNAVFEGMTEGLMLADVRGNELLINQMAANIMGYANLEECSKELTKIRENFEYRNPDGTSVPVSEWPLLRVLRGEKLQDFIVPLKRLPSGQEIVLSINGSLICKDDPAELFFALLTFRDVTEHTRAEKALQESEERFRRIFESSFSGIMIATAEGKIVKANPSAQRLLGRTEKEIIDAESYEFVDPEDPRGKIILKEQARTGKFSGEMTYIRKDGTRFPVEIFSSVFPDHAGQMLTSIFFRDVTAQKRLESILQESEKRLREMAEAMPLLVWTALPDGKVDYFNKRREEIYEQAEKDGYWNLRNFVHPDDMFEILKTRTHKVEPGVDFQVENRFKMKDGSYRWHLSQGKAIRDEKGALVRWIGTATDIHDLKMAEQESKRRNELLEHANRELESFSYSVSHDLRAPLRAINGYATMLMKTAGYKFDEEEKRKFDLIVSNATKMNKLIDDLLAFSRVSRAELHRNRIDMNKVAQAAWEQQLILNPDINVDFKMHSLPDTFGDESLMLQVFHNFLSNAVKFTRRRKEPVIEVGGKSNRSEEIYYVKDNGAGFNMNYRHKLFGVFQRLHSESEYEGTGVGLAIVQRIIHRHGGRVWAEGKVGKGATFYFSLPNNR